MAVCWVWDVKGRLDHPLDYAINSEKAEKRELSSDEFQGLRDFMKYAANSKKTSVSDEQRYISGVNCSPQTARHEMLTTKNQFMDSKDIIAFHGFQSFKPRGGTLHTAHEIGGQPPDLYTGLELFYLLL